MPFTLNIPRAVQTCSNSSALQLSKKSRHPHTDRRLKSYYYTVWICFSIFLVMNIMELEGQLWPNCNPPNTRSVISPLPLAGAPMDFHNRLSEHGLPSEYPIKQPFGGYIYIYCIYIYTIYEPISRQSHVHQSKQQTQLFHIFSINGGYKKKRWVVFDYPWIPCRASQISGLQVAEQLWAPAGGSDWGWTIHRADPGLFFWGGTPPIVILDDT